MALKKPEQDVLVCLSSSMLVVLPEIDRLHNFSFEAEERLDNLELANQVDRSSYIAPLRERIERLEQSTELLEQRVRVLESSQQQETRKSNVLEIAIEKALTEQFTSEGRLERHDRRIAQLEGHTGLQVGIDLVNEAIEKDRLKARKAQIDKYPNLLK
jgi:hypothetical protein